jgi:hypothetical protein
VKIVEKRLESDRFGPFSRYNQEDCFLLREKEEHSIAPRF